jgi:hypothetical protein
LRCPAFDEAAKWLGQQLEGTLAFVPADHASERTEREVCDG